MRFKLDIGEPNVPVFHVELQWKSFQRPRLQMGTAAFVYKTKTSTVPRHIKITKYAWVVTVYPVKS